MAHVYKQHNKYGAAFDPSRCKAAVSAGRAFIHQCDRKPWKDGWCRQHHPDTEAARRQASQDRYDAKWARNEEADVANAIELLREKGYTVTPPDDLVEPRR